MDGAGGQGLPDRGGQSGEAQGRDLPRVLPDDQAAGGSVEPARQSAFSKQMDFRHD